MRGNKGLVAARVVIASMALTAGCGSVPLPGLQAEYPAVVRKMMAPWGEFVGLDSLRPTLRWRPFPGPEHRSGDKAGALDRARDIRYELRIWRTANGYSGNLVYERNDLDVSHHELGEALAPSATYLWTVRARFALDGVTYVTEWGLSSPALRNHVIPNPSCFRFRTPGPAKASEE